MLTRLCHVLSETIWEYRALPAPSNYSYLAFSMDPMDRWRRTYTDFEVRGHLEWLLFELEYTKQNQCVSNDARFSRFWASCIVPIAEGCSALEQYCKVMREDAYK